jgi:hypothetical protein
LFGAFGFFLFFLLFFWVDIFILTFFLFLNNTVHATTKQKRKYTTKKGGLRNKNLNDYYFFYSQLYLSLTFFFTHTHTHTHTHLLIFRRLNTKQLLW